MTRWKGLMAAGVLVGALMLPRPAEAAYLDDLGWGTLTVLSNVFYMPAKLLYATAGGLTGGLAFGLTGGDMETAENIWITSMGGNYVVTPAMLQGQEPVSFAGLPDDWVAQPTDMTRSAQGVDEYGLGGS